MYVVGTFLIENADYNTTVSAVDINSNGQQVYVTYLDSSGNLKASSKSFITGPNGIPFIMSGCSIIQ